MSTKRAKFFSNRKGRKVNKAMVTHAGQRFDYNKFLSHKKVE